MWFEMVKWECTHCLHSLAHNSLAKTVRIFCGSRNQLQFSSHKYSHPFFCCCIMCVCKSLNGEILARMTMPLLYKYNLRQLTLKNEKCHIYKRTHTHNEQWGISWFNDRRLLVLSLYVFGWSEKRKTAQNLIQLDFLSERWTQTGIRYAIIALRVLRHQYTH